MGPILYIQLGFIKIVSKKKFFFQPAYSEEAVGPHNFF
jgi:hypothetical protein